MTPLRKQIIDIPFTHGMDQEIAAKILPPGYFVSLSNCRMNKAGEICPEYDRTLLSPVFSGDITLLDSDSDKNIYVGQRETMTVISPADTKTYSDFLSGHLECENVLAEEDVKTTEPGSFYCTLGNYEVIGASNGWLARDKDTKVVIATNRVHQYFTGVAYRIAAMFFVENRYLCVIRVTPTAGAVLATALYYDSTTAFSIAGSSNCISFFMRDPNLVWTAYQQWVLHAIPNPTSASGPSILIANCETLVGGKPFIQACSFTRTGGVLGFDTIEEDVAIYPRSRIFARLCYDAQAGDAKVYHYMTDSSTDTFTVNNTTGVVAFTHDKAGPTPGALYFNFNAVGISYGATSVRWFCTALSGYNFGVHDGYDFIGAPAGSYSYNALFCYSFIQSSILGVTSLATFMYNAAVCSDPFLLPSGTAASAYIFVQKPTVGRRCITWSTTPELVQGSKTYSSQGGVFLLRVDTATQQEAVKLAPIVGKCLNIATGSADAARCLLSAVVYNSTNKTYTFAQSLGNIYGTAAVKLPTWPFWTVALPSYSCGIVSFYLDQIQPNIVEVNRADYLSACMLWKGGLGTLMESGPLSYIEGGILGDGMTVVVAAGSIPLGDYQYTAILCIKNRNGDLLSSSPISEVMHITVAGTTKKHTFTFDGYFLNNIQRVNSPELFYYIQLYRTDTNGSIFYLVGEQIITTYSTPTIVDNVLYILSNATLYTTGGVLENIYPANPLNTIEANNRVWILTDDNMIWYSKPIEFGLGLQFSDVNIIDIPSVYGKAYSIGSVGDSLIVVCSKGILRIMGEPSDALGLNSTLTLTHLTADYGVNALTFCAP
jgi:hypothetical protein